MLEWLKRHAWKACKPLKGFAGSNPALSAEHDGQQEDKFHKLNDLWNFFHPLMSALTFP